MPHNGVLRTVKTQLSVFQIDASLPSSSPEPSLILLQRVRRELGCALVRNLGRETEEPEKVTQQLPPPLPSAWKMSAAASNLPGP